MKRIKCWRNLLLHESQTTTQLNSDSPSSMVRQIFTLKFKDRNVYHYLLIAIATIVCYWPSIYGELVFDDKPAIIENNDIRRSSAWYRLFFNDYWGTSMQKESSHKSYRPLTVLTFRLNYLLHGVDPIGYHIVNVALHALSSILVHKLCLLFEQNTKVALTSALLFAVHPIHTDAVASIVGRCELLSAIFYESSLLIHLGNKTTTSKYKPLLTLSLTWIGFLCKEQCLTVLIVCALFDVIIFSRKSSVRRMRSSVSILFSGFIFALLLRLKLNGTQTTPTFSKFDNPASVANGATKLYTYTYLAAYNFWMLTFPLDLCCDWTHESIPLLTSCLDVRNVITVAFFSTLCYILLTPFIRKKVPDDFKKTLMFVIMMIIPFVPASNLFFTTGFVVAERVLYLPSLGFVLLAAFGVKKLYGQCPNATISALVVLLISFAVKTHIRCKDWQDESSLFKSGLRTNPRNVKLLNNVGRLFESRTLFNDALLSYKKCIEQEPMDIRGYLNLGNLYAKLNQFENAEEVYEKGKSVVEKDAFSSRKVTGLHITLLLRLSQLLSKDPSKDEQRKKVQQQLLLITTLTTPYLKSKSRASGQLVHFAADDADGDRLDSDDLYNLAIIKKESGDVVDSLKLLDMALKRYPHHECSLLASARIIYDQRLQEYYTVGIERLHTVIEMGRANDVVYFQLGMLSIKSKDYENGKRALSKAIAINANFSEALYNLALLLYNQNAFNQSTLVIRRLLHINPKHLKGSILLCDILAEYDRDFRESQRCYRNVLKVDPNNSLVKHNLCVVLVQTFQAETMSRCLDEQMWREKQQHQHHHQQQQQQQLNVDHSSRDQRDTHKHFDRNDRTHKNKSSIYLF